MKTFLSILTLSILTHIGFAQTTTQELGVLSYKKEIPNANTYKITKNTTGTALTTSVLENINLHRRFDSDYTWVVDENIEILIYIVGKTEEAVQTTGVAE
jgi:hypothetical protein